MLDNFQQDKFEVAEAMAIELLHRGDLSSLYRAHAHLVSPPIDKISSTLHPTCKGV